MSSEVTRPRTPLSLDPLFFAQSVALIGLSADAAKMTGAPLAILCQVGYQGRIFPVNPKYQDMSGYPCYPSIDALPEVPDVALITLAARHVPEAVRACARKGIKAVVVLSSGFEETEEGRQYALDLASAAAQSGIPVVGPNCEGIWSVGNRLMLTFGSAARRGALHRAPIAIISQSGAMAGAIARHLQDNGIGCEYVVSVGNETVLTIADYLEWMIERDDVRVVLLFIEGLRDGQRLLRLLDRARQKGVHIAALKSGNSEAGGKAAASHTGKVASDYVVYQALLREAGVVQVPTLTDLIEFADVLTTFPLPPARGVQGGVAVFSIPGGTRALTVDLFEAHGVPLSTFDQKTSAALAAALPSFGGTDNPTDLTGQVLSHPGLFNQCLQILANDPHTEALVVQVANRGPRDVNDRIDYLGSVAAGAQVPLVISFLGDALPEADKGRFRKHGIICARDPAEAAKYLGWLYAAREGGARPGFDGTGSVGVAAVSGPSDWPEVERYLSECGIAVPRWCIVGPAEDVAHACANLRFPLALKAIPEDVDHKTELGLVTLNLQNADELRLAALVTRQRLGNAEASVFVQEMIDGGTEVLMAALRNADFGPILALGMGGTLVELHRDITYLALPTNAARVRAGLATLKLWTLLSGFRGRPRGDVEALVAAVVAFGNRFTHAQPLLAELEINPLFVRAEGPDPVIAIDALVKFQP
ncbi:acetate--CoA ligase family protein [Caballeronia sp. 15715]|uniref:acetate--CoA ligase family protein n=1 Tax=unclassified Caballeronia TaxID=2646786 RepID=UPI0039E4BB3D